MKEKLENLKQSLTGRREKKGKPLGRRSPKKKRLIGIIIVLVVIVLLFFFFNSRKKAESTAAMGMMGIHTAPVERRDITSTLSSSGTIAPKNTYTITSLAEGEVIEANFEVGDKVKKGQVLYRIDASSMDSKLKSAKNSVERAQSNYNDAVKDYNEAGTRFGQNTYKSTRTGYIKKLYLAEGDDVSGGAKIADIYNNQVMKVKLPFLSTDAQQIPVGAQAILTLSSTQEQLPGVVTAVSSMDETLTGGRLVRYVTIQVENPGGLTETMTATAQIGALYSSADGAFAPTVDTVLAADLPSSVEVQALLVNEGDFLDIGTPIFQMSSDDAQKLIKSYRESMDTAQSSLEQAQSGLDSTQDSYNNYTITAPISGTVIKKSSKVGDKVQNSGSTAALAVIYDMSSLTFSMSVDELDITKVKVGQKVQVTADAFPGQTFEGTVTNVSLEGTSANGVTNYPVTVTLDQPGSILPGMNVDGVIILDSAKDVLAVPSDALMRGNVVYVQDASDTAATGSAPAGFRPVSVVPGLISTDYVEIKSGDLKEGDQVYLMPSSVPRGHGGMNPGGDMGPGDDDDGGDSYDSVVIGGADIG